MATYVVGDIHGCYDEWMALNNRILEEDPSARFILLGDIIDRGPKSYEMIQWMLENVDNDSPDSRYRMVLGNHESEKIEWWKDNRDTWDKGEYLVDRYGFCGVISKQNLSAKEVDHIIEAFKSLPVEIREVVEGEKFYIAHGDVLTLDGKRSILEEMEGSELTDEQKDFMVWNRNYNPSPLPGQIVNGHTPTCLFWEDGVATVGGVCYHNGNRHIVDCGLVYESHYPEANLAALRLDDMAEIYLYEERALEARKTAEERAKAFEEAFGDIIM